jgi:hypothetical protein
MIEAYRARLDRMIEAAHQIRTLRAAGHSYLYIANALNSAGVAPLRGGERWRQGTVHALARAEGIA